MIKIQLDPEGRIKTAATLKQCLAAVKRAALWFARILKQRRPTRRTLLKTGVLALLLGSAAGVGANYLPKLAGQSNITAVQAAQSAFAATRGGIITEAEFKIGRQGSRYEFEILSGGRKYEVEVDAMSGRTHVAQDS
ncbi:PepSY domain-containing protein [Eikenella glucosivorans]|uniref:PepSY domain-containing protein n=1 Tax=Eikenella glucosivorans TaxID=2766967 RepID=UPI001C3F5C30|nr:PepSY domain-containing protein [Eikenella glucosivorans]